MIILFMLQIISEDQHVKYVYAPLHHVLFYLYDLISMYGPQMLVQEVVRKYKNFCDDPGQVKYIYYNESTMSFLMSGDEFFKTCMKQRIDDMLKKR